MALKHSNFMATPGDRSLGVEQGATDNTDLDDATIVHEHASGDAEQLVNFLKVRVVQSEDVPGIHRVPAYAEHYERHPENS